MALDAQTQGFLDLAEVEIGPWTAARAAERELAIPPAALPGVIENVALLRAQTALFVATLGPIAGEAPEPFQP
ncbi:hypothetical protein [Caulobacter sp.]|uniref:hypothetical protein n=1 Tax=Caulobacter sp. TaxID=78 RepID=UPI002B484AC1|nr:hypothetical protein [Caulobacter sp.]HJV40819.1 hypothetical protein [Caulobacter sp.]